jgi:hypothetical protein
MDTCSRAIESEEEAYILLELALAKQAFHKGSKILAELRLAEAKAQVQFFNLQVKKALERLEKADIRVDQARSVIQQSGYSIYIGESSEGDHGEL